MKISLLNVKIVGIITLNRPKALNALSADLTRELETALQDLIMMLLWGV